MKPEAVPVTSMPFLPLPADTLPSGMTPPTCVFFEDPSIRMPSPSGCPAGWRCSPRCQRKLPCTVTLFVRVTYRPLRPLLLISVVVDERVVDELAPGRELPGPAWSIRALPVPGVAQRVVTVAGGPDEVPVQPVAPRPRVDQHPVALVARDRVAQRRHHEDRRDRALVPGRVVGLAGGRVHVRGAADLVVRGAAGQVDAVAPVAQRPGAGPVGADPVGHHRVVRGSRPARCQRPRWPRLRC